MNYNDMCEQLQQEIENEYSIRHYELVSMENFYKLNDTGDEDFAGLYRKSLIIILYSHFEGFCKKVLLIYVDYINRGELLTVNVKDGLAASNILLEFRRLNDSNYKPITLGENALKADGILQMYGKRKEFMTTYREVMSKKLKIPDDIVDTESNLKSHVLKKLLFQLDMDFTIVDSYQKEINELVHKRNAYAHGDLVRPPSIDEYNNYRKKALMLMEEIKIIICDNYINQKYLKTV
ncbi:hypothetical protein Dtox_1428 [Desulfofarcimen acetoxidans DSM 771]|uniref:RiboL-PSP-HEPN domain-containing protein n=1 Tax=Desulfofarcimen acetoxidans (strain ATCC 49208 / DSM 771 / KCTC 5769 / VKM B-1644 / 5575) TaxID=485916 RepID=C8VVI6_DESAS|nr:MAE_28990/MAE_18760 family HEPN-like nuclease [Desulfofarcimen acetoxidans]ACV62301.1 hypothetical protein Dtox_1428 [Desulfofarcimen acetoxidans DSM 771]